MDFEEYMQSELENENENTNENEMCDLQDFEESRCNCNCNCNSTGNDDTDGEYISNGLRRNDCMISDPVRPVPASGTLTVTSRLNCASGEALSNAPVRLYRVDNGCETLVDTKNTDENGNATFNCLDNGVYRVEHKLDPCLFECAQYYPSAHFRIRVGNRNQRMVIVHRTRNLVDPCTARAIRKIVREEIRRIMCCCRCR